MGLSQVSQDAWVCGRTLHYAGLTGAEGFSGFVGGNLPKIREILGRAGYGVCTAQLTGCIRRPLDL